MITQLPASDSRTAVEQDFLLPEEVIKDQLAQGKELALIRINSVNEEYQGRKGHKTFYKATVLRSMPEKKSAWNILGMKRKVTFWDWGPATLAEGCYMTTFGVPNIKDWIPIDGTGSTRKVPESRGSEIFEAHREMEEKILAQADVLPDSVLKAAASGEMEIAVIRITYATKILDSASPASVYTDYRATALRWIAGKERADLSPLLKGDLTLKPDRIYILAFSTAAKAPQPSINVEVFPGNLEASIRMHREKIRAFGKNANAGGP